MSDRYTACRILHQKGVACTCWFEDAVAHHGVPTGLFDLYLLVKDIDAAAQVLLDDGWAPAEGRPSDVYCFFSEKECKPYRRLVWPARPHLHTFLLNATDWGFPAEHLDGGRLDSSDNSPDNSSDNSPDNNPDSCITPTFFPRLPDLVDALIDSILDAQDDTKVSDHLITMLVYLYRYAAVLKPASFAEQLAYEHRQFHYDMQAIDSVSLRFIAHERKVRQQLRDGTLIPHHDPWKNEQECLS